MTAAEKRKTVVDAIKSREGKNTYTQDSRRTQVGSGYGDCSSTVQWAYKKLGIDIGSYTEAQLTSKAMKDVALTIKNGVPDESKMLPGDLLYFRGGSPVHKTRTKHVGHVEMYVGNGQISGHPSGIGPTRKNLKDYCTKKHTQYSAYATPRDCGLICVRRAIEGTAPAAASGSAAKDTSALTKGTTVQFHGTRHYASSEGDKASPCAPGTAKITSVAPGKPYPYHLEGTSVHGWVAAADITVPRTGTIICTSLHIRQKPDSASTSLGIMQNGDTFAITGDLVNGWYPVTWNGINGYAKNSTAYMKVTKS